MPGIAFLDFCQSNCCPVLTFQVYGHTGVLLVTDILDYQSSHVRYSYGDTDRRVGGVYKAVQRLSKRQKIPTFIARYKLGVIGSPVTDVERFYGFLIGQIRRKKSQKLMAFRTAGVLTDIHLNSGIIAWSRRPICCPRCCIIS